MAKKRRKLELQAEARAATPVSATPPALASRNRALVLVLALTLVLLTFAVYWHVLGNGFINMDDDEYVTSNPHVLHGLTGPAVGWAFTAVHSSNWHPLTWISHMLDWQMFRLNPMGHHLTNLLLHSLNVLLVFLLLSLITGRTWRSAFVAALFAIHPLHVESVAWVAERKDVLSTLFWLLTMLAYWWYTQRPQVARYILVAILFALGLMAKPMLVSLPFVLLLIDYWPLGRLKPEDMASVRRLIVEKLPLFALALISCIITFLAQRKGGAVGSLEAFPFSLRFENALVSYVSYLGKMLWPRGLAALYPFSRDIPAYAVAGAVVVIAAITILVIRLRKSYPYLAAGWLWYIITLVPVIGIVQVGNQALADRYTYVPLIGVFIALAWLVPDALSNSPSANRISVGLASVALLGLSILTYAQVGYWRTSITLFRHTISCTSNSNNYIAHGSLAAALATSGKPDEAIKEAQLTVQMAPRAARPHDKLAAMLAGQGRIREGMEEVKKALELDPKLSDAHYDLGAMLHKTGDVQGAIREYEQTLRLNPEDPDARKMLALARSHGGGAQSSEDLAKAVQQNPNDYQAHYRLGLAYQQKGQMNKAAQEYQTAIRLKPHSAEAHSNLGLVLGRQGRLDDALAEFRQALRYDPKSTDTLCNMAVALSMQGRTDEALAALQKAVKIAPERPDAHGNLAVLYFGRQDYAAAWREVELCRKYGGDVNQGFLNNLSAKMPEPL